MKTSQTKMNTRGILALFGVLLFNWALGSLNSNQFAALNLASKDSLFSGSGQVDECTKKESNVQVCTYVITTRVKGKQVEKTVKVRIEKGSESWKIQPQCDSGNCFAAISRPLGNFADFDAIKTKIEADLKVEVAKKLREENCEVSDSKKRLDCLMERFEGLEEEEQRKFYRERIKPTLVATIHEGKLEQEEAQGIFDNLNAFDDPYIKQSTNIMDSFLVYKISADTLGIQYDEARSIQPTNTQEQINKMNRLKELNNLLIDLNQGADYKFNLFSTYRGPEVRDPLLRADLTMDSDRLSGYIDQIIASATTGPRRTGAPVGDYRPGDDLGGHLSRLNALSGTRAQGYTGGIAPVQIPRLPTMNGPSSQYQPTPYDRGMGSFYQNGPQYPGGGPQYGGLRGGPMSGPRQQFSGPTGGFGPGGTLYGPPPPPPGYGPRFG